MFQEADGDGLWDSENETVSGDAIGPRTAAPAGSRAEPPAQETGQPPAEKALDSFDFGFQRSVSREQMLFAQKLHCLSQKQQGASQRDAPC